MPNDANGKPLAVGDKVTIPATVLTVTEDPNYVNCTVQYDYPLPPTNVEIKASVNSKQVQKVESPAEQPSGKPPEKAPAQPAHEPAKK